MSTTNKIQKITGKNPDDFTFTNSAIETLERCVKYVQS